MTEVNNVKLSGDDNNDGDNNVDYNNIYLGKWKLAIHSNKLFPEKYKHGGV